MQDGGQDALLGRAWTLLCLALLAHVIDEAASGFLGVYNPTVMALRERLPWLPLPVFRFDLWISGLLAGVVLLRALRRHILRGCRWARGAAFVFAVLMIVNAAVHAAGTIAGRTFSGIEFPRPMPGFWSSPLLAAASVWMLVRLRRAAIRPLSSSRGGRACAVSSPALRPF